MQIRGTLFDDVNGDSSFTSGTDTVVAGVLVELLDDTGAVLQTRTTSAAGFYSFASLAGGTYQIRMSPANLPTGFEFVLPDVGSEGNDSDITDTTNGTSDLITGNSGDVFVISAGITDEAPTDPNTSVISGRYFVDKDGNNLEDLSDIGEDGLTVYAIRDGVEVASIVISSSGAGFYEITGLPAGDYQVAFEARPGSLGFVTPDVGSNDNIDSDVTSIDGQGRGVTDVFTLGIGQTVSGVDAGTDVPVETPPAPSDLTGLTVPSSLNILFVGNSYLFATSQQASQTTIVDQFVDMLEAIGTTVTHRNAIGGGTTLEEQWNGVNTGAFNVQTEIPTGTYDLMILQGRHDSARDYTGQEDFNTYGDLISQLADANGTATSYYGLWPQDPWVSATDQGAATTIRDTYTEAAHRMYSIAADRNGDGYSPAGLAVAAAYEAFTLGRAGVPDGAGGFLVPPVTGAFDDGTVAESLLTSDATHPTDLAAYLAASTTFASLFGPQNLPDYTVFKPSTITDDEAKIMQDIAKEVATAHALAPSFPTLDVTDDTFTVDEDAGTTTLDVLANDTDATDITAINLDLDDDGTDDILGTVSIAGDGQSLIYNPGSAFDYLFAGQTATETFSYSATDGSGYAQDATVTVTIDGVGAPPSYNTVTFDLTTIAPIMGNGELLFVQDGVALSLTSAQFTEPDGSPYQFGSSGTGSFALDTSNSQAVQVTEGVGVNSTNVPAGDEQAIAGDNPDELIQFTFSDAARNISVTLDNGGATDQVYRLFTDTDTDGTLDTASGRISMGGNPTESLSLTDVATFGLGSAATVSEFYLSSVTVDVPDAIGETDPDAYTVQAASVGSTLNVLANDMSISTITGVNTSGIQGSVTIAADGQSLNYVPGSAFTTLNVGQTATETFAYTVQDTDGAVATELVTVTVEGVATKSVTFDFTGTATAMYEAVDDGDATTAEEILFVQDGVAMVLTPMQFRKDDGTQMQGGDFGTGGFEIKGGDMLLNLRAAGLGITSLNANYDLPQVSGYGAIGGYDEYAQFGFATDVVVTDVRMLGVPHSDSAGTVINGSTWYHAFREFTDIDTDGVIDTISPEYFIDFDPWPGGTSGIYAHPTPDTDNDDTNQVSLAGQVSGIGVSGTSWAVNIEEISVSAAITVADPTADTFTIVENAGATSFDVMANDTGAVSVVGVNGFNLQGSVSVAADGQSVVYDPGIAFAGLGAGETATEIFTYNVIGSDGLVATEVATVTVQGTPKVSVTFDFANFAASGSSGRMVQDGVALTFDAYHFAESFGPNFATDSSDNVDVAFGDNGTNPGVFVIDYNTPTITSTADGLGMLNIYADSDSAVDGFGEDEMFLFGFDRAVEITAIDLIPLANVANSNTDNQNYRLFTDTNNDGTLDTISGQDPNPDTGPILLSLSTETFGVGAQTSFDAFRVKSITFDVAAITGDTVADAFAVDADSGGTSLDVLVNDTDVASITSVDATGIQGSISTNGSTVTYDPGTAFDSLLDGQSATETFTYTVQDINGGIATEEVVVTVNGTAVPPSFLTLTFDLTASADYVSDDEWLFVQDGVALSVTAAQFTELNGTPFQFSSSGTGVFAQNSADVDLVAAPEGLGINSTNATGDEAAIAGNNPDELAQFNFSQTLEVTGVAFDTVANPANTDETGHNYRLFTDSTANGALDTVTGQIGLAANETIDPNLVGDAFGIGTSATISSFFLSAVDVEILNITGDTTADAYSVDADATATVLDVLVNDTDIASITGVDDSRILGTLTVAGNGQSLSYDPGTAFEGLNVGESATEIFTYTVTDVNGDTATEIGEITVNGSGPVEGAVSGRYFVDVNGDALEDLPPDIAEAGLAVTLLTSTGAVAATTTTDANGDYSFIGLDAGDYQVAFSQRNAATVFVTPDVGTDDTIDSDVTSVQSPTFSGTADAVLIFGVTDATEYGNKFNGTTDTSGDVTAGFVASGTTDLTLTFNGYDIDNAQELEVLINGTSLGLMAAGVNDGLQSYTLTLNAADLVAGDNIITFQQNGNPSYKWGVTDLLVTGEPVPGAKGLTNVFTIAPGQTVTDVDAGVALPVEGAVSGRYFVDVNGDALEDLPPDIAEAGLAVTLLTSTGAVAATTTTDANGDYSFIGLDAGDYQVAFSQRNAATVFVTPDVGTDDTIDSDVTSVQSPTFSGTADAVLIFGVTDATEYGNKFNGTTDTSGDVTAGFVASGTTDLTLTFNGYDIDNAQELEVLINGTSLGLMAAGVNDGLQSYTLTLNAADLVAGDNIITFQQNGNPSYKWGVTDLLVTGEPVPGAKGLTNVFTIAPGQTVTDVDAGIVSTSDPMTASVAGRYFVDADGSNTDTTGDTAEDGLTVELLTAGTVIATTTTDANGDYSFTGLDAGDYQVAFTQRNAATVFVTPDVGTDDTIDSDVTNSLAADFGGTADSVLELGVTDATEYGNKFNGTTDTSGDVTAGFVASGTNDLTLTFNGYDIDNAQELEVLINGTSLGLMAAGVNDGLQSYTLTLSAADLVAGDNIITFQQNVNPSYKWGVTDLLVTGEPVPGAKGLTNVLTLAPGQAVTDIDAGVMGVDPMTASVAGRYFVDADESNTDTTGDTAEDGLTVELLAAGLVIATTTTDANGDYSFTGLAAGDYQVAFTQRNAATVFVTPDVGNDDAIDSDVTNSLAADFGGTADSVLELGVTDATEYGNKFNGTTDTSGDVTAGFVASGTTDLTLTFNGYDIDNAQELEVLINGTSLGLMAAGVNDGLQSYTLTLSAADLVAGDNIITFQQNGNPSYKWGVTDLLVTGEPVPGAKGLTNVFTIAPGQAVTDIDAGVMGVDPMTASVAGRYFVDADESNTDTTGDTAEDGLTVELLTAGTVIATTTTDANGDYSFTGLDAGDYQVAFTQRNAATVFVTPDVGTDDTIDSDVTNSLAADFGGTADSVLELGVTDATEYGNKFNGTTDTSGDVTAGFVASGTTDLTLTFNGYDIDNAQELEVLINGTSLGLMAAGVNDGLQSYTLTLNAADLVAGDNIITFQQNGNPSYKWGVTDLLVTGEPVPGAKGLTNVFTLAQGQAVTDIDAGVMGVDPMTASVAGRYFVDADDSNTDTTGDTAEDGLTVELLAAGAVIATTTTDANGDYSFTGLAAGDYQVAFTQRDAATVFVTPDMGTNDAIDSDVTTTQGDKGLTNVFTVAEAQAVTDIDAGVVAPDPMTASVAGRYFVDADDSNTDTTGDTAEDGLTVELLAAGLVIATTTTDANGDYSFTGLAAGDYQVAFTQRNAATVFVTPDVGNDDAIDSDVTNSLAADFGGTADSVLELGVTDATEYGNKFNGTTDTSGDVTAGFVASGTNDLTLTFNGHDIDNAQELEVLINGTSLGLMAPGVNDGLQSYTLTLSAADLVAGDNIITFQQNVNPSYKWGVTDLLVTGEPVPGAKGITDVFTLAPGQAITNVDAGVVAPDPMTASIAGRYFVDSDTSETDTTGDGSEDSLTVELLAAGAVIATTTTDASGDYSFTGLAAGDYQVAFTQRDAATVFVTADMGTNDAIDSDVTATQGDKGLTDVFTLAEAQTVTNLDAGVVGVDPETSSVSGRYFVDADASDTETTGDGNEDGLTVQLLSAGTVIATTTTDASGNYSFDDLAAGDYQVAFAQRGSSTVFVAANVGAETIDSDITAAYVLSGTADIDLTMGVQDTNPYGNNFNGTTDADGILTARFLATGDTDLLHYMQGYDIDTGNEVEVFVNGTSIGLLGQGLNNDVFDYTLNIDAANLVAGENTLTYQQVLDVNDDWGVTNLRVVGGVDLTDIGLTDTFTLGQAASQTDVDAGVVSPGPGDPANSAISGIYFVDTDATAAGASDDGIRDPLNYVREDSATVELLQNGFVIANTQTDEDGQYSFAGLNAGNYQVRFDVRDNAPGIVPANAGTDDALDSDVTTLAANGMSATTDVMSLGISQLLDNVDAGLQRDPIATLPTPDLSQLSDPITSVNILMAGNSFMAFQGQAARDTRVLEQFTHMAEANGITVNYQWSILGGGSLEGQWDRSDSLSVQDALNTGTFDMFIVTGQLPDFTSGQDDFRTYANLLTNLADANGTETVFYGLWAGDWQIDNNGNTVADINYDLYSQTANDTGSGYSPGGLAMDAAWEHYTALAGDNGQSAEALLTADLIHPTDLGAYLVASTLYATIFGDTLPTYDLTQPNSFKPTSGPETTGAATITDAQAALMQQIAIDTAEQYSLLPDLDWYV